MSDSRQFGHNSETYEPTQEQIDAVRGHQDCPYTDEEIREALKVARKWVGRWRFSDTVVARNVLLDGYPHA